MDMLQKNTTIMSEVRKFGKPQLKEEGMLSLWRLDVWAPHCGEIVKKKQLMGVD